MLVLGLQVSREVVGRLMADPAFMQKLVLEQMIVIATNLAYEAQVGALCLGFRGVEYAWRL